jgi:acyl carrier protein
MTTPEIYAGLAEIFHEVFDDPSLVLGPETSAKNIAGWDSFAHLQLIVAVESRFGIKFRTSEIGALSNVGDLVSLIEARA